MHWGPKGAYRPTHDWTFSHAWISNFVAAVWRDPANGRVGGDRVIVAIEGANEKRKYDVGSCKCREHG
jgi:hypothetical protein